MKSFKEFLIEDATTTAIDRKVDKLMDQFKIAVHFPEKMPAFQEKYPADVLSDIMHRYFNKQLKMFIQDFKDFKLRKKIDEVNLEFKLEIIIKDLETKYPEVYHHIENLLRGKKYEITRSWEKDLWSQIPAIHGFKVEIWKSNDKTVTIHFYPNTLGKQLVDYLEGTEIRKNNQLKVDPLDKKSDVKEIAKQFYDVCKSKSGRLAFDVAYDKKEVRKMMLNYILEQKDQVTKVLGKSKIKFKDDKSNVVEDISFRIVPFASFEELWEAFKASGYKIRKSMSQQDISYRGDNSKDAPFYATKQGQGQLHITKMWSGEKDADGENIRKVTIHFMPYEGSYDLHTWVTKGSRVYDEDLTYRQRHGD